MSTMAEDENESGEEAMEVAPVEESGGSRREIKEIRPKNPSPEINDPEPPTYSLSGVIGVIKKKGLNEAILDDAWGPHVHITLIISIIICIGLIVAAIQLST